MFRTGSQPGFPGATCSQRDAVPITRDYIADLQRHYRKGEDLSGAVLEEFRSPSHYVEESLHRARRDSRRNSCAAYPRNSLVPSGGSNAARRRANPGRRRSARRHQLLPRLVAHFTQQTAGDFLNFHKGAFGLAPLLILHGVSRGTHRFQSFVGFLQASSAPSVLFDLDARRLEDRVVLAVPEEEPRIATATTNAPMMNDFMVADLQLRRSINAGMRLPLHRLRLEMRCRQMASRRG